MPSLFRFLVIVGTLVGLVSGSLYALSVAFEPEQREVVKTVPGLKIRKS